MTWPQLLSSIRAAPDDDAPRRVAIDWLQDRGDPRGEFLALTEELERHPWKSPEAQAIAARLATFVNRPWDDAIRGLGVRQPFHFKRGWLDYAAFEGNLAQNFERLMALEPVADASFWNIDTSICERLATTPALAELRSLGVRAHASASLAALLSSPLLANVRKLVLSPFGADEARALTMSPARPESLDLTLIDSQAAQLIANADVMSRVRDVHLDYRNCDDSLAVLARGRLGPLRKLGASGSLVQSMVLLGNRLETLEQFACSSIDDSTLAPLLTHSLSQLRGLAFSRLRCSSAMLARLGRLVEQLDSLVLYGCSHPADAVELLERHATTRLRTLSLDLERADVTGLVSSPKLDGLRDLSLFDVHYDRALIDSLNALGRRGMLRTLTVRGCHDEGLLRALDLPGVMTSTARN